jgi:hypothetical protein
MRRDDRSAEGDSQCASRSHWKWILIGTSFLLVLIAALLPRARLNPPTQAPQTTASEANGAPPSSGTGNALNRLHRFHSSPQVSAEQVVADKLTRFAAKRHEVVHRLARRAKVQVPASVEEYFDALEAGRREEALALYKNLSDLHRSPAGSELQPFWRAIVEANGAAEQVQNWPAQELLDYGNTVLGALRPGMVYVGGTDSGCFIPLMLNETGDGEQHIMLTQNALADGGYLDYLSALYGNQLTTLTSEDSERAFEDYMADAQSRLLHDQSFPDEPKQVQPGETISIEDGKVQVSGQVAVMLINQGLLQKLMDLNPGLSFALEESFPFKSTYAQAAPLGPVMELGVADQNALTPDTAAQTVAFWQNTTDQLLADPEASGSTTALNAYAKMIVAQANLLLNHDFSSEAEQTFRLADELAPGNPQVVFNYVQLLIKQNRFTDALGVTAGALSAAPDNQQFQALNQQLQLRAPGK